jgi:hypothetical protein
MLIEYNGPTFAGSNSGGSSLGGGGSGASSSAHDQLMRALDPLEVDVDDAGGLFDMFAGTNGVGAGAGDGAAGGGCKWFSKASTSACDPVSNTYACVRSVGSTIDANSVYCEFSGEVSKVSVQ